MRPLKGRERADRFTDYECTRRRSDNKPESGNGRRASRDGGVFRHLALRRCRHATRRRTHGHDHHWRVGDPQVLHGVRLGPRPRDADELRSNRGQQRAGGYGGTMPGRPDLRDNFVGRMRAALDWFSHLPAFSRRSILIKGPLAAAVAFVICLGVVWGAEKVIGNSLSCGLWAKCPDGAVPGIHPAGYGGTGAGSSISGGGTNTGGVERQGQRPSLVDRVRQERNSFGDGRPIYGRDNGQPLFGRGNGQPLFGNPGDGRNPGGAASPASPDPGAVPKARGQESAPPGAGQESAPPDAGQESASPAAGGREAQSTAPPKADK